MKSSADLIQSDSDSDSAARRLRALGLDIDTTPSHHPRCDDAPGTVIAQHPAPGVEFDSHRPIRPRVNPTP